MARILILIGGHLWTNPRSQKEADALIKAGHEVKIAGVWFDTAGAERDVQITSGKAWRFQPALDFRPIGQIGRFKNHLVRLRARIARELYAKCGLCLPSLYGYGTPELLKFAMQSVADLTIVRSEAGLWVGQRLLDRGQRVGVDFEDWYSEDILPTARALRPIQQLKEMERRLASACVYSIATSKAMASAISVDYQVTIPSVVTNVFPLTDCARRDGMVRDRVDRSIPSVHWYSQTIGPGRGLELFFLATKGVNRMFEIHVRGVLSEECARWLRSIVPSSLVGRVFVHDTVPNDELPSRIAEHDIGLALEFPEIISRNLTITNKIFQYLQGGLAVIATDTAGQREVFSQAPDIGILMKRNDIGTLTSALNQFLNDEERLKDAKRAAQRAFVDIFNWEQQGQVVVQLVDQALSA